MQSVCKTVLRAAPRLAASSQEVQLESEVKYLKIKTDNAYVIRLTICISTHNGALDFLGCSRPSFFARETQKHLRCKLQQGLN